MEESVSERRQQTRKELIFLVLSGCVLSAISVVLLNKFTFSGIVTGSILEGFAIGCCLVACRMARVGQQVVPVIGLIFVFIILAFELIFAIMHLL